MGILGDLFNFPVQLENMRMQREQQNYDRDIQQQIFQREDTAIQRQAADLEAAGLSKTLAAGGGAGAGQVVHSQAPQMGNIGGVDLGSAIAQMTSVAATNEQIKLTAAQREKVEQETKGLGLQNEFNSETINARIAKVELENEVIKLSNVLSKKTADSKEISNSMAKLELAIKTKFGASQEQARLISQEIENAIKEYNQQWYTRMGLPISPGGSADLWTKIGGVLTNMAEKGIEGGAMTTLTNPIDNWIRGQMNKLQGHTNRAH